MRQSGLSTVRQPRPLPAPQLSLQYQQRRLAAAAADWSTTAVPQAIWHLLPLQAWRTCKLLMVMVMLTMTAVLDLQQAWMTTSQL
jgi:hypothetical protein